MLELFAIIGSAVATIITVVYKVGQLEGRVMQQLHDHERRLDKLEELRSLLHGGV